MAIAIKRMKVLVAGVEATEHEGTITRRARLDTLDPDPGRGRGLGTDSVTFPVTETEAQALFERVGKQVMLVIEDT